MMDIQDITQLQCDECAKPMNAYALITELTDSPLFCSYECAEQAVNNYNVDYAERKADERKYEKNQN